MDVLGTTDTAGRPAIVWARTATDSLNTTDSALVPAVALEVVLSLSSSPTVSVSLIAQVAVALALAQQPMTVVLTREAPITEAMLTAERSTVIA